MSLPQRADVSIAGAGLAGLTAALYLARGGASVVVLEAAEDLGAGASGGQLGMACAGLTEPAFRLVHALGLDGAAEIYRFTKENIDLLAELVPTRDSGSAWVAIDDREAGQLDASAEALHALGVPVQRWSSDEASAHLGGGLVGPALFFPQDRSFDPATALTTLARLATEAGVTLVTGAAVTGVEQGDDGMTVHMGEASLDSEIVIAAAGAASAKVHPWLHDCILPIREQAAQWPTPPPAFTPVARGQYGYLHWRSTPQGLQVAGCRWATPHLEVGETAAQISQPVQDKIEALAGRLYPEATTAPPTRRWAWIEAGSCDGLPFVGPLPGTARRIALCGFAGSDAALAVRAGKGVADGLLVGRAVGVPQRFTPRRML